MFDLLMPTFKINKPIRLIEFFAGYGSQALALKYLGAKFEHYKICEWAINSIIAYASLHRNELPYYGENFCGDLTKEQIVNELFNYGVSADYNKPATIEQLKRMSEEKLRLCYNSIWWTNNLVDISRTKGKELNIVETDKFTYLLTYSFPCQDLSLAGKGKGMEKGSGTRSGLLWEVERILSECDVKPQVLVMENVTQVHGAGNEEHFKQWMLRLEEMGYQNYWQDMIATDYGIPQTRNRTFMVSILGEYNYTFPKKKKLNICLDDLLNKNVSGKYILTQEQLELVSKWNAYEKPLEKMEIIERERVSPTLTTRTSAFAAGMILIKNATKKGYLEAKVGDGIDISSRMESHRGTVQKGKAQTLTTMGGENVGVVIQKNIPELDKVEVLGNYSPSNHESSRIVSSSSSYPTVKENHGTIPAVAIEESKLIGGFGSKGSTNQYRTQNRVYSSSSSSSPTLSTAFNPAFDTNLCIRRLTENECFRLMGLKDCDIELIMQHQTKATAYHLAGDSIVTTCLMAIFSQFYGIDWKDKFKPEEWWKNDR